MLQFFKKSGRVNNSDDKTPDNTKRLSVSSSFDTFLDESLIDDEDDEAFESRSRLSMNLSEIVSDKNCLIYFVQFLETKKALPLIKFYLDAESFKTASELSITSPKTINNNKNNNNNSSSTNSSNNHEEKSDNISDDVLSFACNRDATGKVLNSGEGYDSLSYTSGDICDRISVSSQSEKNLNISGSKSVQNLVITEELLDENKSEVPELKSLCDLTMRKPLTDDEKSQIFAESNKRIIIKNHEQDIGAKIMDSINCPEKSTTSIATDAIRIYRKYLITNSPYFIDIPATISSNISLDLCSHEINEQAAFSITPSCFEEAQKYIFDRLEKEYLNEFLDSVFYCKYCVDILTSPSLKLSDILHSEAALFFFMEYLEQENQRECFEFWIAATNFRKHYENHLDASDKKEVTNDAMILYEKYFSLQSPSPLNISDKIRSRVEEFICGDEEKVVKCFDLPLKIIEKHIEAKHFSNFIASQLFANYFNELKSKIKDHKTPEWSTSLRNQRHRKTRSDCTSESTRSARNGYISQQNTLLAMESSRATKAAKTSGDMQIDSRQLTNPDLLWQRNSSGGLSFGRVDALGRYERDFELGLTDEKWSLATGSNKLKNAVRKLVNLPEDKVQEEIAWQVAEMIVKDITSVTLGTSPGNSV